MFIQPTHHPQWIFVVYTQLCIMDIAFIQQCRNYQADMGICKPGKLFQKKKNEEVEI